MKRRMLIAMLCVSGASLLLAPAAAAHRLDEYLQATRIAIDPERVTIEIDLTPGALAAANVIALIDTNRDGEISTAEGEAYARLVLGSVFLEVDERPRSLRLVSNRFPSIHEMNEGVGVIRLRGFAETPTAAVGRHLLFYRNTHQPEMSVYLANALVPASDQIRIAEQERDTAQHELRFDYTIAPKAASIWTAALWWLIPVCAFAALIAKFRTRS
jgi:hypothetical protein